MTLRESLIYTPRPLAFGTSGLRGLLTDMTDLECYINTVGFITFLHTIGEDVHTIYIAGDLRSSTPRIMQVIAQAISDNELKFVNCGLIPTPALAYYAGLKQQPCIMVTGSHIPDDRNGIKFYKSTGEVLKSDETAIHTAVSTIREKVYNEPVGQFLSDGSLQKMSELGDADDSAKTIYVQRYIDFFGTSALANTEVVMYQHSAVGRDIVPEILEGIGAKVICTDRSEKFIPIDTENVRPDDDKLFKRIAEENSGCFAIVSTDGDSDRPFVIDETGTFHRGDVLGLVVSEYLGSEAVAFPISSNDALVERLQAKSVHYTFTKIGSPYVIAGMNGLKDSYKNVTGWEVNGGFMTGEDIMFKNRELKALPTRDAALPIICTLLSAKGRGIKLSEVFEELPRRYTQAGLIDNFPGEASAAIVSTLSTQSVSSKKLINQAFSVESGFTNDIVDINAIDGVRIRFSNNEVAHLRPSGNAPQLRIYTNASSQERADEIVRLAIAEPDGILRQLEQQVTNK